MAHNDQDRIADYDKAIDQLFEGLKGAEWLLLTGRYEDLGIALSDRTKERLIERHGLAAGTIVLNTGYYRCDRDTSIEMAAPPRRPTMMARIKGLFGPRTAKTPFREDMPRWARLLQERERNSKVLEELLGLARRDQARQHRH
ncbi:hypothetical protein LX81_02962 [Palleronia aestuarii]|uniref:Uncharacterized protein n=1 Tax=Palleronia aestuarii TaxID=568105 RepID=A0A2W7N399_9RHOB|nr:hypothetical protein [Palleronia aestuarii]PZX14163.1 hypothetical protein LX81_02962 [Palleronia aestuarii]